VNKKPYYLIGAGIAVIAAIFVVFAGKPDIKNYPLKDGPIVAFGDSLVTGVGAGEGKDFVSLLSAKIGEPIINLGHSGDTTRDGIARIEEVLQEKPRLVIVLLGGNDFLRKVPRDDVFENLQTIITTLQDQGAAVLLLGVRGGLLSDSADSRFEELALETGSAYVENVLSGLFGDSRYMSDAIHPNDAGHARIAERVYPVVNDLIK
jgi:acyl-CoA thioesterase I